MNETWQLIAFIAFILAMLALDLGLVDRKSHELKPKEAGLWVAFWVALAAIFNAGIYYFQGMDRGLQFTTGYLIEQTLSVDNMFVFVLVMQSFRVPKQHQHKLLFFGVLGALVMRGIMIAAGVVLVHKFHWLFYAFGAFLLFTAFRVATENPEDEVDPSKNVLVRFFSTHFPVTNEYHDGKFFVSEKFADGMKRAATPLFVALICLELTDVLFALDSIPAIFAITDDPFILFTSNVFAILGLRSLYFLLAHAIGKFHLLKYGVALVLAFVGLKMVTKDVFEIPMLSSLAFIVSVIAVSVGLSFILKGPGTEKKTNVR